MVGIGMLLTVCGLSVSLQIPGQPNPGGNAASQH